MRRLLGVGAAALLALAGCGGSGSHAASSASTTNSRSGGGPTVSAPGTTTPDQAHTSSTPTATLARGFRLSSPAFRADGRIPRRYTCDGADVSLPLRLSGIPAHTRELVLVMRDPNAPTSNFVHWAVAGIPPRTLALQAGGVPGQILPGRNSFGSLGYKGPCPPRGAKAHHYVITINALGTHSGLKPGFTADQLQAAAIGVATLVGTYRRP